jgi:endo-1,4-beta-mannosidase
MTSQKVINIDGTAKSFRCKARESLGMKRTYQYAAMTEDEAQRRRWTFYEAVNLTFPK